MDNLVLFEEKQVRRVWDAVHQIWYFAAQDVIEILTGSTDIKQYVKKLKSRDPELSANWGTICTLVKMRAADGKTRKIQAASIEGLLRLIQSVPSPKAEPFKRWLAKVGYERLQEIENPELASKRTREIYRQKGYSESWIEKWMRGIAVRDELTDEWKKRGVKEQTEYAILTAEISKATSCWSPSRARTKATPSRTLRLHHHQLSAPDLQPPCAGSASLRLAGTLALQSRHGYQSFGGRASSRAAEESRGAVRYLRTAYQRPVAMPAQSDLDLPTSDLSPEPLPWPASLAEQIALVRGVIDQTGWRPADGEKVLARHFTDVRAPTIRRLVAALSALGHVG